VLCPPGLQHADTIFLHMSCGSAGTISFHDYLKLVYTVISTRSKYLSQSMMKLKRQKPRVLYPPPVGDGSSCGVSKAEFSTTDPINIYSI
jgi:hypothetical protein